jgi:hypothetical protein
MDALNSARTRIRTSDVSVEAPKGDTGIALSSEAGGSAIASPERSCDAPGGDAPADRDVVRLCDHPGDRVRNIDAK